MRYNILTYHIGEGIRNLFKNKKSTIASLCIMMATMLMFGIFFIIGENINHIMETIEEDQGMQVFIIDEASSKEVQEVRDMISSIDGVASATIYTKQDALDEMKVRLKNNQDVLAGYDENNNIFPDSVIVKLTDLQKSAEVQEKIRNIEIDGKKYVDPDIRSSDKTINALINIANGIKIITGVLLVLLIAISIFIISNTIKLTVHARRKEISIMKYVGATNGFIRWPFIVEGMIIGILASAISIVLVGGAYSFIAEKLVNSEFMQVINMSLISFKDMFNSIILVYMLLGIGIGVLGSMISMRKYLKV